MAMAGWRSEFGADYAVPAWFESHPDLTDVSWHNDAAPSFQTGVNDPGYPNIATVRVWVDHVDVEQRESAYRYMVVFEGEGVDAGGLARWCDDILIGATDDIAVVDAMIQWGQAIVAGHGLSMCPRSDKTFVFGKDGVTDTGLFPEGEYLFDEYGNTEIPWIVPLSTAAAPSEGQQREVEVALEEINRQRARSGQTRLDPSSAGWSDQDILEEAARIRLKNGLEAL